MARERRLAHARDTYNRAIQAFTIWRRKCSHYKGKNIDLGWHLCGIRKHLPALRCEIGACTLKSEGKHHGD